MPECTTVWGSPRKKNIVILHANQYILVLFGIIFGGQKDARAPMFFIGGDRRLPGSTPLLNAECDYCAQISLQSVESELQQVRDSSSHQKKRVIDMMTNLMKDLADIGSSIGSEFKVRCQALLT